MSALSQIRGAPKWAQVTLAAVWILVLLAGLAIGGKLALDASFQKGYEAGVQASASGPSPEPQLPAWLPAGTDRAAALAAMRDGVPFQMVSLDEGFGCAATLVLMPNGQVWWLQHPELGGEALLWEVGDRGRPQMGCDSEKLPSMRGGGR